MSKIQHKSHLCHIYLTYSTPTQVRQDPKKKKKRDTPLHMLYEENCNCSWSKIIGFKQSKMLSKDSKPTNEPKNKHEISAFHSKQTKKTYSLFQTSVTTKAKQATNQPILLWLIQSR